MEAAKYKVVDPQGQEQLLQTLEEAAKIASDKAAKQCVEVTIYEMVDGQWAFRSKIMPTRSTNVCPPRS